jgi:hypothetical protein
MLLTALALLLRQLNLHKQRPVIGRRCLADNVLRSKTIHTVCNYASIVIQIMSLSYGAAAFHAILPRDDSGNPTRNSHGKARMVWSVYKIEHGTRIKITETERNKYKYCWHNFILSTELCKRLLQQHISSSGDIAAR